MLLTQSVKSVTALRHRLGYYTKISWVSIGVIPYNKVLQTNSHRIGIDVLLTQYWDLFLVRGRLMKYYQPVVEVTACDCDSRCQRYSFSCRWIIKLSTNRQHGYAKITPDQLTGWRLLTVVSWPSIFKTQITGNKKLWPRSVPYLVFGTLWIKTRERTTRKVYKLQGCNRKRKVVHPSRGVLGPNLYSVYASDIKHSN